MFTSPISPTSPLECARAAAADGPTLAQIRAVQAVAGRACVSLLLTTTPGAQMSAVDAGRLRALLLEAQRRLEGEDDLGEAAMALQRLAALAVQAAQSPTSAAMALYASASYSARISLPLKVVERVVVDPSFATRDLVRCLHRVPRHVVLALSVERAQLFTVVEGQLAPAKAPFPIARQAPARGLAARTGSRDGVTRPYLHAVDRALGAFLAAEPAPWS